jgi:hypothetical protein
MSRVTIHWIDTSFGWGWVAVTRSKLLKDVVSEIEAEAYRRGFNDGLRAAVSAVKGLRPDAHKADAIESISATTNGAGAVQDTPFPNKPNLRENSDQMRVLKAIRSNPGMRGVEILRALESAGTPVHERTLRTSLGRLKRNKFIEQREERWYEMRSAGH